MEGLVERTLANRTDVVPVCLYNQAASKGLGQPSPTAVLEVGASSSFPASPFLPGAAQAACAGDATAQPGLAAAPLLSDASSHSSSGSRLMPIHEVRALPQRCIRRSACAQLQCSLTHPCVRWCFLHVACTGCVLHKLLEQSAGMQGRAGPAAARAGARGLA